MEFVFSTTLAETLGMSSPLDSSLSVQHKANHVSSEAYSEERLLTQI